MGFVFPVKDTGTTTLRKVLFGHNVLYTNLILKKKGYFPAPLHLVQGKANTPPPFLLTFFPFTVIVGVKTVPFVQVHGVFFLVLDIKTHD